MKQSPCFLLAIALASLAFGQQQAPQYAAHVGVGATAFNDTYNLPLERVGLDDLLGVSVYDSPELTRTVRVGYDGAIRLPMVKQRIAAAGLYPADVETAIAAELMKERVMVDPIVTVSVVEYRSRPIGVVGAVKAPLTFQATGTVTLLDAIARAGGLAEDAGLEILVSTSQPGPEDEERNAARLVQRVPIKALLSATDLSLNLILHGGEEIRVPQAGRIFVVGNVKKPGAFPLTDGAESSVLKALALSEGLEPYAANTAYIYRTEGATGGKNEIPIELKKMIERKAPDVPLMANDIVYIPDNSGRRNTLSALKVSLLVGTGLGGALIYTLLR
jgi:polysaccharide export outer membrane protein